MSDKYQLSDTVQTSATIACKAMFEKADSDKATFGEDRLLLMNATSVNNEWC